MTRAPLERLRDARRAIINMRHRLAHDYWLTDSRLVLEVGLSQTGSLILALDRLIATVESDLS